MRKWLTSRNASIWRPAEASNSTLFGKYLQIIRIIPFRNVTKGRRAIVHEPGPDQAVAFLGGKYLDLELRWYGRAGVGRECKRIGRRHYNENRGSRRQFRRLQHSLNSKAHRDAGIRSRGTETLPFTRKATMRSSTPARSFPKTVVVMQLPVMHAVFMDQFRQL